MRRFLILLFSVVMIFSASTMLVRAEEITRFSSDIVVHPDASFTVTETIRYDFGVLDRHGIYRDIPYKYKRDTGNYNVRIKVQSVTDQNKEPYQYEVSTEGDELRVKIGDPDSTLTGMHTYLITYQVTRAINSFNDHDELYWNTTGNGWDVGIKDAQTVVHLPSAVSKDQLQLACFSGYENTADSANCSYSSDADTVTFKTSEALYSGQGLTLVVGIPKGMVTFPGFWQEVGWFIQDNWVLFVPVVLFLYLFMRWWFYGRDPETHRHIAPMYSAPDNLSSAEVGVVVDESADMKDISSSLIQLAVKGYIKIRELDEKKKEYQFIRLKSPDDSINGFERQLMDSIFGSNVDVRLSDLKNKFYKDLPKLKQTLYTSLTSGGYFPVNPEKVRGFYMLIGIFFIIAAFFIGGFLGLAGVIACVISAVLFFIFGAIMPRRTLKGAQAHIDILGLKLYLSRAEKKQIDFHNAPEKKPETFEKLLPYAMVLGVETAWAKEFQDIYQQPPDWYEGSAARTFNSLYFVSALNTFSTASTSTFASAPSSSAGSGGSGFSGGFSGGGFGGGGGGSW